jgi:hypothetical protein
LFHCRSASYSRRLFAFAGLGSCFVAAVATAIALISQTYQIQGPFADFMRASLFLSIPIVAHSSPR